MLFISFTFLIFFPIVVAVYFAIPHRFRWAWLLLASCYFYMAFIPVYILILFFTIIIDYFAGILIDDAVLASVDTARWERGDCRLQVSYPERPTVGAGQRWVEEH